LVEKRRDVRECDPLLLDAHGLRSLYRVLEREISPSLEEAEEDTLVEPCERRMRRSGFELEGVANGFLRGIELSLVTHFELLVDGKKEPLSVDVLERPHLRDVSVRANATRHEHDGKQSERGRTQPVERSLRLRPYLALDIQLSLGLIDPCRLQRI